MRAIRWMVAFVAAGLMGLVALPALTAEAATKPPNDLPAGAKTIGALPYNDTLNTTNATTDQLEVSLNDQCGAPAVQKGVWYKTTVPSQKANGGTAYRVSGEGSSYSVGLMVVVKDNGNWVVLNCGPFVLIGDIAMQRPAGSTVFILAFDYTPGSQGGTLRFNVRKALPIPTVNLHVDDKGTLRSDGSIRLHGTASCSGPQSVLLEITANVTQERKIGTVFGGFFMDLTVKCSNTPINWVADAQAFFIQPPDPNTPPPPVARFVDAPAQVDASAFAANPDQSGFVEVVKTVTVVK
jgi:hypothetical protein